MQHQGGKSKPGRKPGSGNKKRSEAILKREFGSGEIMPLDVMLSEMRRSWAMDTDGEPRGPEGGAHARTSRSALLPSTSSGD